MWTCPICNQQFVQTNQYHSCGDRTIDDFFKGKSRQVKDLFDFVIEEYRKFADLKLHPAKARIAFVGKTRYGYISQVGKNFIDIVLHFNEPYRETLCFFKVAQVPESPVINHYIRLYEKEDFTEEVKFYLKKAYDIDVKRGH